MTVNNKTFAELLRRIADAIEPLDKDSFEEFLRRADVVEGHNLSEPQNRDISPRDSDLNNAKRTSLRPKRTKAAAAPPPKRPPLKINSRPRSKPKLKSKSELLQLLNELQLAPDRAAGSNLLISYKLNRPNLVALAKVGEVHVVKTDTVERVQEKLIENFIGSRLNSKAIRGSSDTDAQ